jgi:hypothetical protein
MNTEQIRFSKLPNGHQNYIIKRSQDPSENRLLESFQNQINEKLESLENIRSLSEISKDNYKMQMFVIFALRNIIEQPGLNGIPESPNTIYKMKSTIKLFQNRFDIIKDEIFKDLGVLDNSDYLNNIELDERTIQEYNKRVQSFMRFLNNGKITNQNLRGVVDKMQIPNVEKLKNAGVEFTHFNVLQISDQKISLSPDKILLSAKMCKAVYNDKPDVDDENWRPLDISEFNTPKGYTPDGKFVNKNAVAFVQEAEINGDKTIVITFKGTDAFSPKDWLDNITHINRHYNHMRPLTEAVDKYIEENDINHVIATGHSLGGAMAALYMHEHHDKSDLKYSGVSFGSPGAVFPKWATDDRMLCFRHKGDPVPHISNWRKLIGKYDSPGIIVEMKESDERFTGLSGFLKAHSMDSYVESIQHAYQNDLLDHVKNESNQSEIALKLNESKYNYIA